MNPAPWLTEVQACWKGPFCVVFDTEIEELGPQSSVEIAEMVEVAKRNW
jgi:hypothetical protein